MATKKPELKMTEVEYWKWSYYQQIIETRKEKLRCVTHEMEIKRLKALINNMAEKMLSNEYYQAQAKIKESEKDLHSFRENIAKRLKLDNFDEYIIDTDSFKLIHKDEIGN